MKRRSWTPLLGALLAIGVVSTVAAADVCKCIIQTGPFKVWVMLDTRTVAVLNTGTGQLSNPIDMGGPCNSITLKPDCSVAFVGTLGNQATGKPPGFCDIDCATLQIIADRPLPAPPIPNGMICKGDQVWIAMENGQVAVFDCVDESIRFVDVGGGCNSIVAKCDGSAVFVGTAGVAGVKGPGFCDIDCATLQVVERPLPVPPNPNAFWWDETNQKLWMMLQDFSVYVFDCIDGNVIACIPVGGGCNSMTGKCDGSTVFVGNVGGAVPQQFFPGVPFGQGGGPTQGTGNFNVDSFFDVTYEIEIQIPGQPPIPLLGPADALRGDVEVLRGPPQRDWLDPSPSAHATIQTEMLSMNLSSVQPIPIQGQLWEVHVELAPQPSPGELHGAPGLSSGDFPVQPVDSFFDVFFDIEFRSLDGLGECRYRALEPVRLVLDPQQPEPLTQIPFGCDWWITPPGTPPIQFVEVGPPIGPPILPPEIFIACDRLCFPPPPPPKPPGVCDIPCDTFIPVECDLPAPPIPCGVQIRRTTGDVFVAMQNGTVGAWDCFWNPLIPAPINVGGGCTDARFAPDGSILFVGTAGVPGIKPPGLCDINPDTFDVLENPTPGVPLPKGMRICPKAAPPACPCDWNGDGNLNDQDWFDWVNDYFTQTGPRGSFDFNGDGNQNDQDWFDFANCFFNPPPGC